MKYILITLFLFLTLPVQAKHLYKESVYQDYWCNKRGGILEYELNDKSRVDCLLPDMAVEFDFARKRDECLGQALRYSAYTDKQPACCLIIEKKKDYKYYYQLRYTIQKKGLGVKLFTVTPSALIRAGILSDEIQ
jgi:hypothetical protein